ncbi:hypothetical protein J7T55_015528 [Diaporthe amygdali]|uniref:uncharacterized protein n=1 Tax=Phomopsis amygdali TaxID=1214568 RepID=UPI0022FF0C7B|nr:uncharacterized protein J7T55_015528 [Diaporthe amygdali]KAJ0120793.1 hypothetical protein J7T55_015528 [Diaporthe amygdali]
MLPVTTYWRVVVSGMLISAVLWLLIFRESFGMVSGLGYASQVSQVEPDAPLALPGTTNSSLKPLILYAYSESETARPNLEFFLKKGLHGGADFIFIFNGETDAASLVPEHPNVKIVHRENKCFDLGGMGEILRKDDLWKRYKRFITMNASIRGPFLPRYARTACWSDLFLDRVTETVKLVGTTINCQPSPHVQSMLWATDDVGTGILLDPALAHSVPQEDHWGTSDDPVGLSFCHETMFAAVHSELGSTRLITSQGYGVDVLMTAFEQSAGGDIEEYCKVGQFEDILYDKMYYGSNLHPYETVFFKSNREIDPTLLEKLTDWHLKNGFKSWDTCK